MTDLSLAEEAAEALARLDDNADFDDAKTVEGFPYAAYSTAIGALRDLRDRLAGTPVPDHRPSERGARCMNAHPLADSHVYGVPEDLVRDVIADVAARCIDAGIDFGYGLEMALEHISEEHGTNPFATGLPDHFS